MLLIAFGFIPPHITGLPGGIGPIDLSGCNNHHPARPSPDVDWP